MRPLTFIAKAPSVVSSNRRGYLKSNAIGRISFGKTIVSQSPEKGKVYNGLSQLRISLQKVWQTSQRTLTLSLQCLQAKCHVG